MKKLWIIFLSVIIVALAGCGMEAEQTETEESQTAETVEETKPQAKDQAVDESTAETESREEKASEDGNTQKEAEKAEESGEETQAVSEAIISTEAAFANNVAENGDEKKSESNAAESSSAESKADTTGESKAAESSNEQTAESTEAAKSENVTETVKEQPQQEVKAEPEPEPQPEPQYSAVSYNPDNVVSLAIAKCQAGGMMTTEQELDMLLAEGRITQDEYNQYYPLDGMENSYYSVFVNVDLNKAATISGRLLESEEEIADHIAGMLLLEVNPVFNIRCVGTYDTGGETFYEFRCYR